MAAAISLLIAVTTLATEHAAVPPAEQRAAWEWDGVSRVVAVGDLHGSDDKLLRLLSGAGLINENLHWSGGTDHLVVAGDFIDRGSGDRQIMDLLRRLQVESIESGGRVHVLLGNHEVMNLFRDTRYVGSAAFSSFVNDEERSLRKVAWKAFAAKYRGRSLGETRRKFNREFPAGFFARQKSFELTEEYGSWLMVQPAIVKVNGVVFVHGGLSVEFAALGVAGINQRIEAAVRLHLESRRVLETGGVVTPAMRMPEIRAAAENALSGRRHRLSIEVQNAAEVLLAAMDKPILKSRGPLWYRGNSFEDERIERETIERSLALVDAKAIVVAHSPTRGGKITSRFHGQLFRVDHGIGSSERPLALVVEREEILVLDPSSGETTVPISELPPGEFHSSDLTLMSDDDLRQFLSKAAVIEARDLGRGSTRPQLIVLERSGQTRRAVFKTVEREADQSLDGGSDRYQHEVAAFYLDSILGLNMVPVTVIRKIDGRLGSLQSWVARAVDQAAARAYELFLYDTDTARQQLELGEFFDALIGNHYRKPADILLSLASKKIYLIDHSRAFSASPEIDWSPEKTFPLGPDLEMALKSLDRKSLKRELGELISDLQIEALLTRRDRILALFSSSFRVSRKSSNGSRSAYPMEINLFV